MASEKAPVKLTGGGGFRFEDRVASLFMAHMLAGGLALGAEYGTIREIHFQVRDRGWLLDDLLLVLERDGNCALSIKSNLQVTQNGFPADFVKAIWEQRTSTADPVFDPDRDLLTLVTARVADTVKTAWDLMLSQATETEPDRLVSRLEGAQSSAIQRQLFESLHCPPEICAGGSNQIETARLLRSLRLLTWDFETEPSEAEAAAISLCRSILRQGDTDAAISLWERLLGIAAEARPAGGSYDLAGLLTKLRGGFEIKDHPDFQPDWNTLDAIAGEAVSAVRAEIGQGIQISRRELQIKLQAELAKNPIVALIGESGCGKSAIVARAAKSGGQFQHVIWLDRTDLDQPTHAAIANELMLRHTIPELLRCSAAASGLVVFDALEHFSSRELDRAAELLKVLNEINEPPRWKALITVQPQAWDHLLRELFRRGVRPQEITRLDIEIPKPAEVLSAVAPSVPGLGPLLLRRELQRILCNLKVLDWIIIGQALRADGRSFVGESDIIDWVWNERIGHLADKHARAALLMAVGERDGESLASAVSIRDLRDDERRTLGELEADQLLRARAGQIFFAHDLLGDWARLQSLLASGNQVLGKIRQVSGLPRWQVAIRLYAQRLLENQQGAGGWKEAIHQLQADGADQVLAADYFLDALIFAGNAEAFLEQVWPDLIADKAHLLFRFLKRFQHVATLADPRVVEFADRDDFEWFSTRLRIPYFLYWYPTLRVLDRHAEDVARLALILAAQVCELWLRTIPPELGGRPEAGRLALRLAREAQGLRAEGVFFMDGIDQKVHEALFQAAPDFPDEVSQIALELCRRRDESPEIVARVEAHRERERAELLERLKKDPELAKRRRQATPPSFLSSDGPLRDPAPDGPKGRVPDSVQIAVLASPALIPLARTRPAIAREVLLAVCIDEPRPGREDSIAVSIDYGTTNWRGGYPPMYFRGPFLQFLQVQPEEGLDAIIRLVNYATERWAESALRRAPADLDPDYYSLEFPLSSGKVRWIGNFDVYLWHRANGSNCVASALMALEKWLYDEIDAGRPVDQWIEQILRGSQSLAFAGLLITVAVRTSTVLTGALRPLLGAWRLFEMQRAHASQDEELWSIGISGWAQSGEEIIRKVLEWNRMPHRKRLLERAAIYLFQTNKEFAEFMEKSREEWSRELEAKPNEDLETLIATFDPRNYVEVEQPDGEVYVQLQLPESLRARTVGQAEEAAKRGLAQIFPYQCRKLLEGDQAFTPEQAEQFWVRFQSLVNRESQEGPGRSARSRSAIVSGGVAVLVTFNRSWLAERPDRQTWCMEQLQLVPPQERTEDSLPQSHVTTASEGFVGEAAFGLMPDLDSDWVRDRAAKGLAGYYYASTRFTIRRAFTQRVGLGSDFIRALNLVIFWSALRGVENNSQYSRDTTPDFERPLRRLIRAYAQKRLPVSLVSLDRVEALVRRAVARIKARDPSPWRRQARSQRTRRSNDVKLYREHFYLDTEVIKNGFGFLGSLDQAISVSDRAELISYHSLVLSLFIRSMPKLENDEEEVEGTPYEFDQWVCELVTRLIPQLTAEEDPSSFWKPFIDLSPGARYWVENFFRHWFVFGLQFSSSLAVFGHLWANMIEYALDLPLWSRDRKHRHYLAEYCWYELMGLGFGLETIGKAEFAPVLQSIQLLYKKWAERWLDQAGSALRFAILLSKPSGTALLPDGIVWLNRAAQGYRDYEWRRESLDESFAGALRTCWRRCRQDISDQADLRANFLQLLNTLCKRLSPDALDLRNEVAQFIPQGNID
ncbi:MAG: hypothetical protein LAQ69_03270 [Acidobacteriia bacterium]|nr:hypothetical protein [Terriglobia bacterium]